MDALVLTQRIFAWHYTRALADIFFIWKNFFFTIYRVFNIGGLLRTLFAPWRRLSEPYKNGNGFDLGQIAGAMVVNTMMRIVGLFVRVVFIVIATILFLFTFLFGVGIFLVWLCMPVVVVGSLSFGITLLFL